MNQPVAKIKCLGVIAQVTMGYYDEDGNLLNEELFPQVDGSVLTAKLFHPHVEQLKRLLETCVEQAWAKLGSSQEASSARNGGGTVGEHRVAKRALPLESGRGTEDA